MSPISKRIFTILFMMGVVAAPMLVVHAITDSPQAAPQEAVYNPPSQALPTATAGFGPIITIVPETPSQSPQTTQTTQTTPTPTPPSTDPTPTPRPALTATPTVEGTPLPAL